MQGQHTLMVKIVSGSCPNPDRIGGRLIGYVPMQPQRTARGSTLSFSPWRKSHLFTCGYKQSGCTSERGKTGSKFLLPKTLRLFLWDGKRCRNPNGSFESLQPWEPDRNYKRTGEVAGSLKEESNRTMRAFFFWGCVFLCSCSTSHKRLQKGRIIPPHASDPLSPVYLERFHGLYANKYRCGRPCVEEF